MKNLLVAAALMVSSVVSGSAYASQCPYCLYDAHVPGIGTVHVFLECSGALYYYHPYLQ